MSWTRLPVHGDGVEAHSGACDRADGLDGECVQVHGDGMAMAAHEVSLASAEAVAVALEHAGYHVVRLTIAADGTWHDGRVRLPGLADAVRTLSGRNVVIPVVHGPRGEDGTLAALCDLGGITCVGSGLRAGALGMDKQVTKLIAADSGIATAPAVLSPLPRPPATAGPAPS